MSEQLHSCEPVKIPVKNAVNWHRRLLRYGVFHCDFDFDSHEWISAALIVFLRLGTRALGYGRIGRDVCIKGNEIRLRVLTPQLHVQRPILPYVSVCSCLYISVSRPVYDLRCPCALYPMVDARVARDSDVPTHPAPSLISTVTVICCPLSWHEANQNLPSQFLSVNRSIRSLFIDLHVDVYTIELSCNKPVLVPCAPCIYRQVPRCRLA